MILSVFAFILGSCRLLQLQRSVISPDSEIPDELLYGRAGYLYALLYVNKEIGPGTVDENTVAKVSLEYLGKNCFRSSRNIPKISQDLFYF